MCIYACVCVCVCVRVSVSVCLFVCLAVCFVCICIDIVEYVSQQLPSLEKLCYDETRPTGPQVVISHNI